MAIIDGPLYQRPWGRDIFRSEQLKRDWGELTRRRIEVLERARGEGVIVAGSVKRLDKSRLLVRAHGSLAGTLEIVYPPQDNDQAEAVALARRYIKERGLKDFRPLLIGPLKMRPPQNLAKDLGIDPPDIAYSYIVIPHLPYRGSLEGHCSVLRVELLWDTYEGLCSRSVDVFFLLAAEGFVRLGLPPAQDFAHRRCNKLSHALFEEMCRRALSEGIDLTYDTYDMFARGAAYEE